MIAEESLKHLEDRKEVFNEQNDFGLNDFTISNIKNPIHKRIYIPKPSLGERAKNQQEKKTLESNTNLF